MLNLLDKISISYNISKNKDNVKYKCYQDIDKVHELAIDNIGITIQMEKENDFYLYCPTYNYLGYQVEIIGPKQQTLFDKMFIIRMYNKMLNYYIAKNGAQNNKAR